ncbi:ABC transporter ATP-binding protein [Arthrobacter sp. Sa2CUA1]|uniref:ABC transporter ATP-binding protein n=1 Tax=Arthrobacter gallicola TaxID=2762225 RepID=A0ABR8US11_9MICC|nr:ABC transporter ATP-binding protein [Arthrobacter gallicola]MBD7995330.1 ABC transporter ATP-binding protein [Arthrobacter gallicola]
MPAAIQTHALSKRYGATTAVASLDLTVEPGSVFGLIGPNGSGKTTTLRMLLDIIRPTAGTASVLGASPRSGGPALRRRIGYIPGDLRLGGRIRGRTLLHHLADLSSPVPPGSIDSLAERLGLDLSRPVGTLSKGNRQKLGLVQAFMHNPDLLILDEPTSGLDPLVQREFLEMVHEARAAGRTVLLSSHVLSEIQQAADMVAVLSQGRVVAQGDVASLRLNNLRHVRAAVAGTEPDTLQGQLERSAHFTGTVTAREGNAVHLRGTLAGGVDPFIKVLARYQVLDLAVEEPDLEESVLSLYGRPWEAPQTEEPEPGT